MIKTKYNLKIALVSNNQYGEDLNNLHGANKITEEICNCFKSFVSHPEEDIIFLKDINHTDAINKLYPFIDKAGTQENNVFLFYFCGHGKISYNNISELKLALKDTSSHNFDSIGISFNTLINKIKNSNIKRFIVIIDSCCSGLINETMGDEQISINDELLLEGAVYISSVKGVLPAFEEDIDGEKIPWFSYCFWKAFAEEMKSKSSFCIDDVFSKTFNLVSNKKKLGMVPQISTNNYLNRENIFANLNATSNVYNETLDVIDWRITFNCNNHCPVCYACSDDKSFDLSEEQIDIIINKLSKIQCNSICISGGEPTCSEHFEHIVQKLFEKNFSIFLSTNGTKFMHYREEIESCIEKLSLPLDGYDEKSNTINGRNSDSFNHVKEILEYYQKNKPHFPIKISTVLTKKTSKINHLQKIYDFLSQYDIFIWKIYEFIPENRGSKNKNNYTISKTKVRDVQNWINGKKDQCNFKIELVKRKNRDSAYFIIQPNGDIIIPKEDETSETVVEERLGNIIEENFDLIIQKWNEVVNKDNYFSNIKLRKINQSYLLLPHEKDLLYSILSENELPSLEKLSKIFSTETQEIESQINLLYEHRIIKNIIPIVNLKMFKIKTYLATLYFSKFVTYPEGHLEEYLCYNSHIGWVTKCDNNTFRIAIFVKESVEPQVILDKIKKDLNYDVKYEIYDLNCSYSIGEQKLFYNVQNCNLEGISKYNSNEQCEQLHKEETMITYEEFFALKQIEELRKPLKENVDKKTFLKSCIEINKKIDSLKNKGIIERLSVILDTRLLGYNWYIIFVSISNEEMPELIEYLITNFNNVTHINSLKPYTSDWNLDFEVHVSSNAELEKIYEAIEQRFDESKLKPALRIFKECKFSFLPHSVADIILSDYVIEQKEGTDNEDSCSL